MEILNNIWTALSTPNEKLANIIVMFATFIENYLIMALFLSLLNIHATKNQKSIYVILMSFVSIISMLIIPDAFNIIVNSLIMILIAHFIFNISIIKSILSVVSAGVIFNIAVALISNPFITIFQISSEELTIIPIYRLLYMILIYTFVILIILILKNRNWKITFIDNVDKKSKFIIFANLSLGIITLCVQTVTTVYYIDTLPIIITFLSCISLIAYFVLSIYSLTRVFKLTLTTQKLQSAEEYNNTLRILHDNVRGFKHDFDNIVTTIGGYIRTNDLEGLKKYYVQLEDDCQNVNNLYILNPEVVNNDGIYNLLTKKYHEAESKNIKVNITFLLDLSTLKMKIYEFARILGILLDNAIEASSECDKKVINLIFRNDTKNSRQLVIIENTYRDKDINTDKIFLKGISGKENHSGLGLWEVRNIVKKNSNVNLHTSKTDDLFIQQLEIY